MKRLGAQLLSHRLAIGALGVSVMVMSDFALASVAPAAAEEIALNGTFIVVSDGQWAKTRYSFHDEATVTQTWTVTSTCSDFLACTGRVTSDQGWSADLRYMSGQWRAVRVVPNWQPCADGTAAPGEQNFLFYRDRDTGKLVGEDKTIGPSGGCGVNQWLTVSMPMSLTQIG
jgi:hypothetical protein